MSTNKNISAIPTDILNKLKILDQDLKEEEITIKGYCKRKWVLLQRFAKENIIKQVEEIQNSIAQRNADEKKEYLKMFDLLKTENLFENRQVLSSIENLRLENNLPRKRKIDISNEKSSKKVKSEFCDICKQSLESIKFYTGHPKNAVEEFVALTDPKLILFTGEETEVNSLDALPHNKITNFTIYDKNDHICAFDSGLIENNSYLYFSGYLKPIYDENPSIEGGIPVKDLGPINEWWLTGFDGGKNAIIGFSTAFGEYYLMKPSSEYKTFMVPLNKKIFLTKTIIEFLIDTNWKNPSYEDLLDHINDWGLSEEDLLENSQFVCNQVSSFDSAVEESENFLDSSCMKTLVDLSGDFSEKKSNRHSFEVKKDESLKKENFDKAMITDLVKKVFEKGFPENFDEKQKRSRKKGKRNFQKSKASSDSDSDFPETETSFSLSISKRNLNPVIWQSDVLTSKSNRTYYKAAKIAKILVKVGDFVLLPLEKMSSPPLIAKIIYMWEEFDEKLFHAQIFYRGADTILGEISDSNELFLVDECENYPLEIILKKTEVYLGKFSRNTFFCVKNYDKNRGRFTSLSENKFKENFQAQNCEVCWRKAEKERFETPFLKDDVIYWRNEEFRPGSGIFLLPETFKFDFPSFSKTNKTKDELVDEEIYPEYYRKKTDTTTGIEISEPFCIGYITKILENVSKAEEIFVQVRKLYRPENTHQGETLSQEMDLNLLFWSEEEFTINFSQVTGKCFIIFSNNLQLSVEDWSREGPHRFYFRKTYNSLNREFVLVDDEIGKNIGKQIEENKFNTGLFWDEPIKWLKPEKPLRAMDVFAGCGGLSEGLHRSGVAVTHWAIEKEKTAAEAFQKNNPGTKVFSLDCNTFLEQRILGERNTPSENAVDLLIGGPPCQGFSGMNRFTKGRCSRLKNSLIATFLSFCDFFRPRFFIMENVRNFVTFQRGMMLKVTLQCLLTMGYQCTWGILQAGAYGVPQSRRRLIILAAAPGEILPEFPEQLHVFKSKRANQLDVVIDNQRYNPGFKWTNIGAPYRTITVRDAMSDLPPISNSPAISTPLSYSSNPTSHFQRMMRSSTENFVRDHVCKEMAPIVVARMAHIPISSDADWRDLPNIVVELSDGTSTKKLKYEFDDVKNGRSSKGSYRGVCPCASAGPCDISNRQPLTLIPWCLPHTANRHNNWTGLYGRLDWNGVFATTVTNPEPMGKQGRVLHPEQNRVVSVRECARSQGFPDSFVFVGNLMDKHRQIGNAVPPFMGEALGKEILKCLK